MRTARLLITAGIILLSCLILASRLMARLQPANPLAAAIAGSPTLTITETEMWHRVGAAGRLHPIRSAELCFAVSGMITHLYAKEGSYVERGSLLAKLEDSEYRLAVLRAENALRDPGAPCITRLENSLALEVARQNLIGTEIRSPFSGVVTKVGCRVGDMITAGQGIMTVMDKSSFEVRASVDEADIQRITMGQTVSISFDAYPGLMLGGKVSWMGASAMATGDLVTIPVGILVHGAVPDMLPGITAVADILVDRVEKAVRIPFRSWIDLDGIPHVVLISDGGPSLHPIRLGMIDSQGAQVVEGLSPGDIIADNVAGLKRDIAGTARRSSSLSFGVERR